MRADRLLSLLMLLQARGRMSARQLAEELEVCERTVYRDMVALSTAGVPVYGQAGPDGGFQLLDNYRTNLTGLSEGETRALFMLNVPGPLAKLGLSQDLKTAMLKLAAALPESRRLEEERVRERFYIDSSWWSQDDEPLHHMRIIQQAVWEDRKLSITYIPIFSAKIERVVEPYGLAAKSGSWFLVYSRAGRMRARRISDLIQAGLCSEKFTRLPDFDLGEFWRGWCAEEQRRTSGYQVTIRVTNKALPSLLRFFGPSIRDQLSGTSVEKSGSHIVKLYFRGLEDARERLLPFGSGVEVLEPFTLRANIADIAEQTSQMYHG